MFEDRNSAEPFGADISISLLKNNSLQMVPVVMCSEVIKQPHVKCGANRAEFLQQCMIEAGKMFVVEGLNNWVGDDDRAGNDGVGARCAALNQHLIENTKVVLHKPIFFFEMRD